MPIPRKLNPHTKRSCTSTTTPKFHLLHHSQSQPTTTSSSSPMSPLHQLIHKPRPHPSNNHNPHRRNKPLKQLLTPLPHTPPLPLFRLLRPFPSHRPICTPCVPDA